MKPITYVSSASTRARANALMQRLDTLRNQKRLTMHVVEREDHYFLPEKTTNSYLEQTGAEDIPSRLQAYDPDNILTHMQLFSSSLLPTDESGWSTVPYMTCPNYMNNYGYLLNMTQNGSSPPSPRVMRIEPTDFSSGMDYTNKNFKLERDMTPAIKAFYRNIYDEAGLPPKSGPELKKACIIHAMGGPKGAAYAEQQLDMLAAATHVRYGTNDQNNKYGDNIAHWDEIISTLCSEQVEAISVPVFETLSNRDPKYVDSCKLQAALIGLSHIEKGYHWPVVLYHVTDPNKGKCSFIGQSREELKEVALKALQRLGSQHIDPSNKDSFCIRNRAAGQLTVLHEAVETLLGVDLALPADGPDGWKSQVSSKLALLATTTVSKEAPAHEPLPG